MQSKDVSLKSAQEMKPGASTDKPVPLNPWQLQQVSGGSALPGRPTGPNCCW